MLTHEESKQLSVLKPWRAVAAIAGDWSLIGAALAAPAFLPHPMVFLASALVVARTQLALGLIMHDGVHGRLFKDRRLNDWAGQLLAAGPIFFSFYSYKYNHLKHHKSPLTPDDPDITLIGGYPISKASLLRKLLRDATGVSYFKFIKYFMYGAHQRRKALGNLKGEALKPSPAADRESVSSGAVVASILGSNALLFGALLAAGHPGFYLWLWLLPSMTLLQLLLRVRGIAEHAGRQPNENQMLNSRTIAPRSWQTFFFAPHNVHYHIEHHEYVSVPFYNLPAVHALLEARGSLPAHNVFRGYGDVLREVVT